MEKRLARIAERRAAQQATKEKLVLARLEDDNYVDNLIKLEDKKATIERIKATISICSDIVTDMPIYSSKTRENRKFNPSKEYGLGTELAELTGLLSGIQYSSTEHKAQMLAETGLDEVTIEAALDALGSRPYYNKTYALITEGKPADVTALKFYLEQICDTLQVECDLSSINQTTFDRMEALALARAEKAQAEDQVALNLGLNVVDTK